MKLAKRSPAVRLRSSSRRRQRHSMKPIPAATAISNSQLITFTQKV